MKIELTRAEVERIILAHLNSLMPGQDFNIVEGKDYMHLPLRFSVSKVEENAAQ